MNEQSREPGERGQAASAIRLSRRNYRELAESLPHVVFEVDDEGRLLFTNRHAFEVFGYSQEDYERGLNVLEIIAPEDRARALENMRRVLAGEDPGGVEYTVLRKDGSAFPALIHASPILYEGRAVGLRGILQDITDRKRFEAALRESEERYRQLFEMESDAIFLIDNATGRILEVNAAAAALYGYERGELLRMHHTDLSADPGATRRATLEHQSRVPLRYGRKRDGTVFCVEIAARHFVWQGRNVHVAAIRDISERLGAQEELERQRSLLQRVLDNSPSAIYVKDREGRILLANRMLSERFGQPPQGLVGKNSFDLVPDAKTARAIHDENLAILRGELERVEREEQSTDASGQQRWSYTVKVPVRDEAGRIEFLMALITDITTLKQAEQEARRSQELLQKTFASLREAVFIIDAQTMRILDCNPAATTIFGYSREELVGQVVDVLHVDREAREEFRLHLYRAVEERGFLGLLEFRMKRKDGTVFPSEHSVVPLMHESGKRIGWVSVVRDIGERKHAEEERRRSEARLQEAQRLESLGVLAGGIAHDFNNLLTGILGHADMARLRLLPGSPARESLEQVVLAARRAAGLTQQLLAYAGRGRVVFRPLHLEDLIAETMELLAASIPQSCTLQFQPGEEVPPIEGDETQLRQVVMNLILNAAEAIGNRAGAISIRTSVRECTAADLADGQTGESLPSGRYVMLEMADTGCGMTEEVKSRIFEPFFTTKVTGRGLGLAAVLGIARRHSGTIRVASLPGRGTTMTVLFPVSGRPVEPESAPRTAEPTWQGRGTILVVDDEVTLVAVAEAMLQEMGFGALSASDGREAIELFREHAQDISAVLLDLAMPRIDGAEVCRELRRIRPQVPVILCSGIGADEAAVRIQETGLDGFLQKPFTLEELAAVIRGALEKARPDRA